MHHQLMSVGSSGPHAVDIAQMVHDVHHHQQQQKQQHQHQQQQQQGVVVGVSGMDISHMAGPPVHEQAAVLHHHHHLNQQSPLDMHLQTQASTVGPVEIHEMSNMASV